MLRYLFMADSGVLRRKHQLTPAGWSLTPSSRFVNGENLGNVKQTHWDPLLRPTRGVDGRWTVDAWGPLDGRNINGGVRVQF